LPESYPLLADETPLQTGTEILASQRRGTRVFLLPPQGFHLLRPDSTQRFRVQRAPDLLFQQRGKLMPLRAVRVFLD